jgi:putative hydrolase of the HAD superfamily
MIKNIVFDFGQVLVHFEPEYMVGRYVSDPADAKLLENVVFDRLYWDRLDAGTITDEETVKLVKERLPERLWDVAEKIYYNWIYNIPEIDGMRELIVYLKENYKISVFLTSNISKYFVAHRDEIPMLKLLDNCIFSSTCGYVKPDVKIFEHLINECGIKPDETLFVDDRRENVEGASMIGILGYIFDGNAEKLKIYIDTLMKNA